MLWLVTVIHGFGSGHQGKATVPCNLFSELKYELQYVPHVELSPLTCSRVQWCDPLKYALWHVPHFHSIWNVKIYGSPLSYSTVINDTTVMLVRNFILNVSALIQIDLKYVYCASIIKRWVPECNSVAILLQVCSEFPVIHWHLRCSFSNHESTSTYIGMILTHFSHPVQPYS